MWSLSTRCLLALRAPGLLALELRASGLLADRGLAPDLRVVALALTVVGALAIALPLARRSLAGTFPGVGCRGLRLWPDACGALLLACGLLALLRLLACVAIRLVLPYALHTRGLVRAVALRRLRRAARLVVALPALFAAAALLRQHRAGGHDDGGGHQRRLDEAKSEGEFHRIRYLLRAGAHWPA